MPTASPLSARRCLELDHDLDHFAVVHRPIAIGHTVEVRYPIEDSARIDPPSEDVRKQLVDVGAGRSGPAAHADVLPERDSSRKGVLLRDADAADSTATTGDLESGVDGLLQTNALQNGVSTEAV